MKVVNRNMFHCVKTQLCVISTNYHYKSENNILLFYVHILFRAEVFNMFQAKKLQTDGEMESGASTLYTV